MVQRGGSDRIPRGANMKDFDVSIVIPVFNKWNFTKACLDDLSHLPDNHEIVVVDNASTDETSEEIKKYPRVNYKRCSVNYGFAKACNWGFFNASGKHIVFLNNDIRVKSNHSDWTSNLINECKDCLVGPTMGQLDKDLNFVREANAELNGNSYLSGWCIAASRETWMKLHMDREPDGYHMNPTPQIFSEEFGLAYFEDTDLGFRARRMGIPMKVISVPVVHFGKMTSKQLNVHQLYQSARKIFINKWKK